MNQTILPVILTCAYHDFPPLHLFFESSLCLHLLSSFVVINRFSHPQIPVTIEDASVYPEIEEAFRDAGYKNLGQRED